MMAIEANYQKKINAKNAFDLSTEYMDSLAGMLNRKEESWNKASQALEAFSTIYSYRVDSVHTDMFKILSGLHRSNQEEEEQVENGEKKEKKKRQNFIEQNKEKLQLKDWDMGFTIDPFYKQTTDMFSQINARSLLQYQLDINENLDIVLDGMECPKQEMQNIRPKQNNETNSKSLKSISKKKLDEENNVLNDVFNNFKEKLIVDVDENLCVDLTYYKNGGRVEQNEIFKTQIKHQLNDLDNIKIEEIQQEKEFLTQFAFEVENTEDSKRLSKGRSQSSYSQKIKNIQENDFNNINLNEEDPDPDFDADVDDDDKSKKSKTSNNNQFYNEIYNNFDNNDDASILSENINFKMRNDTSLLHLQRAQLNDHLNQIGKGGGVANVLFPTLENLKTRGADWEVGKNKKKEKPKKEQKKFDFGFFSKNIKEADNQENEIIDAMFKTKDKKTRNRSKSRNNNVNTSMDRFKHKKRLIDSYNYQKTFLLSQFTNPKMIVISNNAFNEIEDGGNAIRFNMSDKKMDNKYKENNSQYHDNDEIYNDFEIKNDAVRHDDDIYMGKMTQDVPPSTQRFNLDFQTDLKMNQNKIERLYRVVDVRKIKLKLWDCINKIDDKGKKYDKKNPGKVNEFKNIVNEIQINEFGSGVSSSTAFVCLLHLCNEKGKILI